MTHPRYERDRFDPPRERTTSAQRQAWLDARNLLIASQVKPVAEVVIAKVAEAYDKAMEDGQ